MSENASSAASDIGLREAQHNSGARRGARARRLAGLCQQKKDRSWRGGEAGSLARTRDRRHFGE